MSQIMDFADDLQIEVVSDMANSYFGARKELDNALDAFTDMVKEFLPTVELLFRAASTLRSLLLDDQTVAAFCDALNLKETDILPAEGAPIETYQRLPFALTGRGRYMKSVCMVYTMLCQRTDVYLHGRYFDDPDRKGHKRLTMHYERLQSLSEFINGKIDKVNNNITTTGILRKFREMSPDQVEREDTIGGVNLQDGSGLDKDLCFIPIDFEGYELPVVHDLPPVDIVRTTIRKFCGELYPARKAEALQALAVLQGNE